MSSDPTEVDPYGAGRPIRDIVRSVIASQASQELPYFTRLARNGDAWVLWRLRHRRRRDEPLGFGLGEVATLVTPVIWIAVNAAAREAGTAAGDGLLSGVRALMRRLLGRKPRAALVPKFTEPQQERVRDVVYEELVKRRVGKQRAADIANTVFHELSAAPPAPPEK